MCYNYLRKQILGGLNLDKSFDDDNMMNGYPEENDKEDILITDEVIAVIAGIACSEVEGCFHES